MGIAHLDDAPFHEHALGHLRSRWTMVGGAAGCEKVGLRRIQVPAGGWSTPAHEHGLDEEIFYVLSGRGVSWPAGEAAEVRAGDCIVYLASGGEHTLHALDYWDGED
ncbi:MAG: cupin domain-containing protein [Solirubrobacteraceae bacterium]